MPKIGRNAPCPCGSGVKYKRCHGGLEHLARIERMFDAVPTMRARHEAQEYQRIQQQGHGKPIISAQLDDGRRFVAVRNRLMHSRKWKTFHDFLGDYIKAAIGEDWGNAELRKPLEKRHPLLIWYAKLCESQQQFVKVPGKVASAKLTGAVAAYMHLAYNLYALDHEAELQNVLLDRLRHRDQFAGARYEIYAAASLIRAGFSIAFENEADGSRTHCEFTATYAQTGKQFSVEAKRAEGGRVQRQLIRALKKAADHERIVFIDLCAPDHEGEAMPPGFIQHTFNVLRRFECMDPQARRLPAAYVLLTNTPWEYALNSTDARCCVLADGFHIPDFKLDRQFASLREAVTAREAHVELHDLLKSLKSHADIPATFDGENPQLAFAQAEPRLVIGNTYRFLDEKGNEVEGVLTSAAVAEKECIALCAMHTVDDKGFVTKVPLSDAELRAWKQHPETFFGKLEHRHEVKDALGAYDFCMATYTKSSREKLLELLAGSPDFDHLSTLDQSGLARAYCELFAVRMIVTAAPQPEPFLTAHWPKQARVS